MDKNKVDRINELGRISRSRELTEDEKQEQKQLRDEYIKEYREKLRGYK